MSEQYELDFEPRRDEGEAVPTSSTLPDYEGMSDDDLRKTFLEKFGLPIPTERDRIIKALKNPDEYIEEKMRAKEEDATDRNPYRVKH